MHCDHSEESLKNVIKNKTNTFRVEIRKKNIGETLNTKRCKHIEETNKEADGPDFFLEEPKILDEKFHTAVKLFFDGLGQNNSEFLLTAVVNIRKMITINLEKFENTEWIVSEMHKLNLLFHFINFVDVKYYESEIIKEAMWSLINISSSRNEEVMKFILDCGLYSKCIEIISNSNKNELINDAAWIIGNLLETSTTLRDDIIYNKIIEILLIKANECPSPLKEHIYKDAVFLMQITTRIEPYFNIEIRKLFAKEILKLLENSTDPNMIYICVTSFCEICLTFDEDDDNSIQFIQEIINLNGISTLLDIFNLNDLMENLASGQASRIIIPITKIFGILSLGDDNQTKALLDKGILQLLIKLLNNKNKVIRRNSCWILSNLLASNQNLVAEITLQHTLLQKILTLLMVDELEVRLNILFCFKNAFTNGTQFTYEKMINFGIIDALLSNLTVNQDSDYLSKVLECLELILVYGEEMKEQNEMNPIAIRIEKKSGLEILENLQYHHNKIVTEKLEHMVKNYFNYE